MDKNSRERGGPAGPPRQRTNGNGSRVSTSPETPPGTIPLPANMTEDEKEEATEKLPHLIDFLKTLTDRKFTGSVKFKFTRGSIERVEQFEEILKNK